MKPVDMIDLPMEGDEQPMGDCLRACVASIFELKVGLVPHFMAIDRLAKFHWTYSLDQWLAPQGLWYCEWPIEPRVWSVFVPMDGIYVVGSGRSPRFLEARHAVVMRLDRIHGATIAHDPHPSRDGLQGGRIETIGMFLSRRFTCPEATDED